MLHVQIFAFLAKVCKNKMIDELDRQPCIEKTIIRINDTILSFLAHNSPIVWKGCGLSIVEIMENCIEDK